MSPRRASSRRSVPEVVSGLLRRPKHDAAPERSGGPRPHVLMIVQNLPVPLDRRVWLECQTLKKAGYDVTVICPKGPGDPSFQEIDGIRIHKYRPAPPTNGFVSYVWEFGYSWARTAVLSAKVWRHHHFSVMQACNPPDTYWLLARLWRDRGVKFVFDQHDLNPELFESRFGMPKRFRDRAQYYVLRWLEQMTYRTADMVISTNESYRAIAMGRGQRAGEDVVVVRSGPETHRMRPLTPDPARPRDSRKTLAYLGIMGPQDGVDQVLVVMHELVHNRGRKDVRAVLMGFGDCFDDLKAICTRLDLDDCVTFTGRANLDMIADELSLADVGVCPDLKSPLNDVSTMNKTMEYMAYALPSVAYDLVETRVSGGDSTLYVPSGDTTGFADAVERLLDDEDLRCTMGREARRRVSEELDWRQQAVKYRSVFSRLTGWSEQDAWEADEDGSVLMGEIVEPDCDHRGRRYVDLDETTLRTFIADRSLV
ncbi:glycosyltransferase family 4 protein [Microlunatus flavus]|uniref:glycosyltransferase family 4 protein n=1 Tax=Microlunatus flavus TaxID=1036181 RepID=UPI001E50C82B|nr:glycosyltransferase family 4 protein [Microlunatus flavus]